MSADAPMPDSLCICRCEDLTVEEIRRVIAEGNTTLNDVKRRTRAGMGLCQGIYCLREVARLIEAETGIEPPFDPMTNRPPARPIPAGMLADLADPGRE